MKKLCIIIAILLLLPTTHIVGYALPVDIVTIEDIAIDDDTNAPAISYLVIDENKNIITQLTNVEQGDSVIIDYNEYEIDFIDYDQKVAYAKYIRTLTKPRRDLKKDTLNSVTTNKRKIGLYMTHNDESYMIGDGVSSINGAGGIHDIAKNLASDLNSLGYETIVKETIHNPHDSGAYTRSRVTAKALLSENVDALFDIHRDGVARSVYVKTINGEEKCKVRIVIGKGNANYQKNLDFALQLVSVAEDVCPWLFLDIYSGKGTYNQNLREDILLFEMGTYLAEKDLVMQSTDSLAKVIDATLDAKFVTTTPEDSTQDDQAPNMDNVIDTENNVAGDSGNSQESGDAEQEDTHIPPDTGLDSGNANTTNTGISQGEEITTNSPAPNAWEVIIAIVVLLTLAYLAYRYVFRKK